MPLDRSVLGNIASEQMEALDADFGDEEGVEMGGVITIVEVLRPQGEPNEQGQIAVESTLRIRHNIGDPYRVVGLLQQVMHDLLASGGPES
jgi:hypothetical protein